MADFLGMMKQAAQLQSKMQQMQEELGQVEVETERCKGCGFCVEFCPTKVLEMKGFVVAVKNLEACIKCMQCELRCPDFAIKVTAE